MLTMNESSNGEFRKCPSCGSVTRQYGIYYCPKCNVRYEKYDPTLHNHTKNNKIHKAFPILCVILLIAFTIWMTMRPKTVESKNGWMHQIGNFGQCDLSNCERKATQRCYSKSGNGRNYCDEHWESLGQSNFDRLVAEAQIDTSSDRETEAKICAKKVVEDHLKAPSTAKFCKYYEMNATNLGENKWKITGYVDAQNSFGATLRENWTVTLTLTTSGFTNATVNFY